MNMFILPDTKALGRTTGPGFFAPVASKVGLVGAVNDTLTALESHGAQFVRASSARGNTTSGVK